MTQPTTLVFPASTPDGRAYLADALLRGERVVGASCDAVDPTNGAAPWRRLPLVHQSEFLPAFASLVRDYGVTQVYASAHMVHAAVSETIRARGLDLRVINRSSMEAACGRWNDIFRRAETWRDTISAIAGRAPELPFLAGVIRLAFDLFGESYDDKLAGLLACLTDAPRGDIVEIGALFGRSAAVLLAGRHERKVFVFDPWSAEIGAQEALPEQLRAHTARTDFETIASAFEATFAALAPPGAFSAFRVPSLDGRAWYCGERALAPLQSFAPLTPGGRIALLHIDGNHDAAPALADVQAWSPLVAPGGWVVIDDYCWRYGDGPKLAGDALLANWGEDVARAFVLGDCLFVQRAS